MTAPVGEARETSGATTGGLLRYLRATAGEDVVRHLTAAARAELAAYATTVTDWELHRGFDRT